MQALSLFAAAPTAASQSEPSPLIPMIILFVIILAIVLVIEFIPFVVAMVRGHNNAAAIFLVCLFFSWTIVGWFVAMIWAFTDNTRRLKE